jgi:hypothetical protein
MKVHNPTAHGVYVPDHGTVEPGEGADVPDGDAVKELIEAGALAKGAAPKATDDNGGEA